MDRHGEANSRFSNSRRIARTASHGNLKPGGVVVYKPSQM